jgi:hypothetical protein
LKITQVKVKSAADPEYQREITGVSNINYKLDVFSNEEDEKFSIY